MELCLLGFNLRISFSTWYRIVWSWQLMHTDTFTHVYPSVLFECEGIDCMLSEQRLVGASTHVGDRALTVTPQILSIIELLTAFQTSLSFSHTHITLSCVSVHLGKVAHSEQCTCLYIRWRSLLQVNIWQYYIGLLTPHSANNYTSDALSQLCFWLFLTALLQ